MTRDIVIMGCRGYTRNYGGWETLVHHLIDSWPDPSTRFFVFELSHDPNEKEFETVNGVNCIRVFVKRTGNIGMLLMDAMVLTKMESYMKKYGIRKPILLELSMRCGELYLFLKKKYDKLGITVVTNTDGMGWKRKKFNPVIAYRNRLSMKLGYRYGVDCLVNDCEVMQQYYENHYKNSKKKFRMKMIPYGTYKAPVLSETFPQSVKDYFDKHGIRPNEYYLMINRLVPENSYDMILSEFIKSDTKCDFIVICNHDKEKKYYQKLAEKIPFESDKRVKFVGTLYDKEILSYLRKHARGYINGHTVGGTNPGLLESLATTDVNIVRDCSFSREGAADAALYFSETKKMRDVLTECDNMTAEQRKALGDKAKERMATLYTWEGVCQDYYELFESLN